MQYVDFKERNTMVTHRTQEYPDYPAFIDGSSREGQVVFCMRLTFWERIRLLFTGKIWGCMLCFGNPIPPHHLTTKKSDILVTEESTSR